MQVFGIWLFGEYWCAMWLAVDVWTCTSSILHLVIISADRFVAVTRPITYPNIMTGKRAKMFIAGAWVLSFLICFPPLLKMGSSDDDEGEVGNSTVIGDEEYQQEGHPSVLKSDKVELEAIQARCSPQCALHQERFYVIYSSVGSFYIPITLMMYFNFRIYRTATNTTRAIRQGFTKVKGSDGLASMGIHRGGGGGTAMALANSAASTLTVHTPRKGSASMRGAHSVASSRRPSASCLTVNGTAGSATSAPLRRQQTIAVESSRTLPRSATSSTSNGGNKIATANGRVAGRNSIVTTTNLRRGSTSDNNLLSAPLLSPHMTPGGSRGRNSKRNNPLSSSTNSLHVPGSGEYGEAAAAVGKMHHSTSANSGFRKYRSKQKDNDDEEESVTLLPLNNKNQQRPHMSHHQPCPNHIMGKTFAEQGTQTLKDDRILAAAAAAAASGKNGKKRLNNKKEAKHIFRWRSEKACGVNVNVTVDGVGGTTVSRRSESPCSMTKLGERQRRRRLSLHSCFRFHRWKAFATARNSNRHSANSGSSGAESAPGNAEGGGGGHQSGVVSGAPSAAASHSDLSTNKLTVNDSNHAKGFGKRNIKSQVGNKGYKSWLRAFLANFRNICCKVLFAIVHKMMGL